MVEADADADADAEAALDALTTEISARQTPSVRQSLYITLPCDMVWARREIAAKVSALVSKEEDDEEAPRLRLASAAERS